MFVRALALIALLLFAGVLRAQYPVKPVTLVVPFAPGSDADLSARNLAKHAQKYLGNQPIVLADRSGASGTLAAMAVRTAPADGYTLLLARIATHAIQPAIDSTTPYKWHDFTIISTLESSPYVCAVREDAPYKSMAELLREIEKTPGALHFSTAGAGTLQNFGPQYLFTLAGMPRTAATAVHYKGSAEVVSALLAGQVRFACSNLGTLLAHIQAGKLRGLLTSTQGTLPSIPQVPAAREIGFPEMHRLAAWSALMGPPGLPEAVVGRWLDALGRLARDKEWLAANERIGAVPALRTPEETKKFIAEQHELFETLATRLGIRR